MKKECFKCKAFIPISFFHKDKYRHDGLAIYCKKCVRNYQIKRGYTEKAKQTRKLNYYKDLEKSREKGRNQQIKQLYGITKEEFDVLVRSQNGKCFICGITPKRLYIDHCHKTKVVRKLLCRECNTGIGMLKENVEIMQKALEYVNGAWKSVTLA